MNEGADQLLIIVELIGAACLILWITAVFLLRKEKEKTREFKYQHNKKTLELDQDISKIKEENTKAMNALQVKKNQQIERVHKEMKQIQSFYETDYKQKVDNLEQAFQDKTEGVLKELEESKQLNDDFIKVFPIEVKKKEDAIKEVFQKQLNEIVNNQRVDFEQEMANKNDELAKAQEIAVQYDEVIRAKKQSDEELKGKEELSAKNEVLQEEIEILKREKLSNDEKCTLEFKQFREDLEQETQREMQGVKDDRARMESDLQSMKKQLQVHNQDEKRNEVRQDNFNKIKAENEALKEEVEILKREKLSNDEKCTLEFKQFREDLEQEMQREMQGVKDDRARMESDLQSMKKQLQVHNQDEKRNEVRQDNFNKIKAENEALKEEVEMLKSENLSNYEKCTLESKKLREDLEQENQRQMREAKYDRERLERDLQLMKTQLQVNKQNEKKNEVCQETVNRIKAENKELERALQIHVQSDKDEERDKADLIRTKALNQELKEELKEKRVQAKRVDMLIKDLEQIKKVEKQLKVELKSFQKREEAFHQQDHRTPETLQCELDTVKLEHEKEIEILGMKNIELEKQLRALMFKA